MSVSALNYTLGLLTIAAQILTVLTVVVYILPQTRLRLGSFLQKYAFSIAFIAALIAILGSLFYPEIGGYEPCKLCWYQRILMYPQVLLLGMALKKKSKEIRGSILLLSGIGIFISAYHYLLQLGIAPELPCSAVGYSASCAERFVLQFGYITIPLMAFSAFLLIATVMFFQKLSKREGVID